MEQVEQVEQVDDQQQELHLSKSPLHAHSQGLDSGSTKAMFVKHHSLY